MVYPDIKTVNVSSSYLDIMKVALKKYANRSFKKYNFLEEFNLSRDELMFLRICRH